VKIEIFHLHSLCMVFHYCEIATSMRALTAVMIVYIHLVEIREASNKSLRGLTVGVDQHSG